MRIHRSGRNIEQVHRLDRDHVTPADVPRRFEYPVDGGMSNAVLFVANIEARRHSPRHYVAGARLNVTAANGSEQSLAREPEFAHRVDPLTRARERIAAQVHRRRTSVIGRSREDDVPAALPHDRINHAQRDVQMFEARALLDVDLEIRRGLEPRVSDSIRIKTVGANRFGDARIGFEKRFSRSDQRAASDETALANLTPSSSENPTTVSGMFSVNRASAIPATTPRIPS